MSVDRSTRAARSKASLQSAGDLFSRQPFDAFVEPLWLAKRRGEVTKRFVREGMPGPKHEAYRFTPLRMLADIPFASTDAAARQTAPKLPLAPIPSPQGSDDVHVWVVDGVPFLPDADNEFVSSLKSCITSMPPASEAGDSEAGGSETKQPAAQHRFTKPSVSKPSVTKYNVAKHLGAHASPEHFSALNLARFVDGVVIHVPEGAQARVRLTYLTTPSQSPNVVYPRLFVHAEPNAQVAVTELFLGPGLPQGLGLPSEIGQLEGAEPAAPTMTNAVAEWVLEEGAQVDHVRVIHAESPGEPKSASPAGEGVHMGTVAVEQRRRSRYASRMFTLGGRLSRVDLNVNFAEEDARCVLDGAYHATGDEHVDHRVTVRHQAPRCTTHETYRGVVDGRATAVFDGIVVVGHDALRSEAHQQNHNLLLSDDAVVHTKPHLEIDTDDVVCSHGATVGSLDEREIFYLQSRGIARDEAEAMLTRAFVQSLVDLVDDEPTRTYVATAMESRLGAE